MKTVPLNTNKDHLLKKCNLKFLGKYGNKRRFLFQSNNTYLIIESY